MGRYFQRMHSLPRCFSVFWSGLARCARKLRLAAAPALPAVRLVRRRFRRVGGQRGAPAPGSESGWSTFQARCSPVISIRMKSSHRCGHSRNDTGTDLRSLTTGSMQMQSQGLNDGQKRVIAEFMSGRTWEVRDGRCEEHAEQVFHQSGNDGSCTGSGMEWMERDAANTRFQTAQGRGAHCRSGAAAEIENGPSACLPA